jgi:hypothetical protein
VGGRTRASAAPSGLGKRGETLICKSKHGSGVQSQSTESTNIKTEETSDSRGGEIRTRCNATRRNQIGVGTYSDRLAEEGSVLRHEPRDLILLPWPHVCEFEGESSALVSVACVGREAYTCCLRETQDPRTCAGRVVCPLELPAPVLPLRLQK